MKNRNLREVKAQKPFYILISFYIFPHLFRKFFFLHKLLSLTHCQNQHANDPLILHAYASYVIALYCSKTPNSI